MWKRASQHTGVVHGMPFGAAGNRGTGKFAPDFTVIAKRRSARWLNAFLRSGHKIMPDFVFKADQADAIVAYILSLKKS